MISKGVKALLKQPDSGIKTSDNPVRSLFIESYLILYETSDNRIVIYSISR